MPRLLHLIAVFAPALLATGELAAPFSLQQEPATPPLPEGAVALLNGEPVTLEAYKEFLWKQSGKRALPQMLDEMLLLKACERFHVSVDTAAVEATVAERLAQISQGRPQSDFASDIQARGFDEAMLRASLLEEALHVARLDALLRATRVATDQRLQAAFDAEYGPGGVQLELRQVLCMPHVLRAEKIKAGADAREIDLESCKAEARSRAEDARHRLLAGEAFAAVAEALSHDQTTRLAGGQILNYRPGIYGAEFTAAVAALKPGETSAVIETAAGFHIVEVTMRTVTDFQKVRASLVLSVMSAEPNWQEREELLAGLRNQAKIQLW